MMHLFVHVVIITLIDGFLVEKPLYQPEGKQECTSENLAISQ